jgi:predicted DNA-binding ribbon-helix-helix protein
MKSLVVKRSVVVAGHKTSVSLEDAFWNGLKEIASGRNITLSALVTAVDSGGRRAICHRPFASSYSTFIATSSPT